MVLKLTAPDDYSFTFSELRFMTGLTKRDCKPDTRTYLDKDKKIKLNIPLLSSAMQSVSGPKLAIALAEAGGLGVIYCSQPIDTEAEMIKQVKTHKAAFIINPTTINYDATINDLLNLYKIHHSKHYPVIDGEGLFKGFATYSMNMELLSDSEKNSSILIEDYGCLDGKLDVKQDDVKQFFTKNLKVKCVPIVYQKKLQAVSFSKDLVEAQNNPDQFFDSKGRLMVAGAINTKDYEARVPALVDAGVDVLLIDSSDGFSEYQADAINFVKNNYNLPIVAGNVIDKRGYQYLVDAGADCVKVGIGGGSICITQEVKGIGRGQAKAVYEISKSVEQAGVPIISDGGIAQDVDILKALALGANAVMMGRKFAGFEESPTKTMEIGGAKMKPYWGEGTNRAQNWQRYGHKLDVEEGVEAFVPFSGPLKQGVNETVIMLKQIMCNLGVYDINQLHQETIIEYVSEGSRAEGKPHDVKLFHR
ncbi:MAG: IMP dehydrogenase [Candidatus Nanoarchaeia archaeon]|jgi:IMP dehydrogenase